MSNLVAIDCEMVLNRYNESMLAWVAIVDSSYNILLDTFVKPTDTVADYRTPWSGIRAPDLLYAPTFASVQTKIKDILRGKIVVCFDGNHDFSACKLDARSYNTRDVRYHPRLPQISLKNMVRQFLNYEIQDGEHNAVEDAIATMKLYNKYPF